MRLAMQHNDTVTILVNEKHTVFKMETAQEILVDHALVLLIDTIQYVPAFL